jgi:hypothetical protein
MRVASPEIESGLVSLEKGALLFEGMKIMVQSSARCAHQPKPHFRARLSQQTESYLKMVRLGQTEVGSYIVKVLLPVEPNLSDDLFPEIQAISFDRQVSMLLASGLHCLETGVRKQIAQPSLDLFLDHISEGVNANLCDALVMIGEAIPEAEVNTEMTWAKTRPSPDLPKTARFQDDDFSYLAGASRALKAQDFGEEMELTGFFKTLSSEKRLDGGDVVFRATVGDRIRSVKLNLNPEQYQIALDAHKEYRDARIEGVVEQLGQKLVIPTVSRIELLSED